MAPVHRRSTSDTAVWNCWLTVLAVLVMSAGDAAAQAASGTVTPVHMARTSPAAPPPDAPAPDAAVAPAAAWPPTPPGGWPRLRIADPVGRQSARNALDLAWRRLADADCVDVLSAFTDRAGRPLGERLRPLAVDLPAYLRMVVFIDGSRETPCVTGVIAFTAPGSRVVRLCVDEVKRTWQQDPEHTLASFLHEMLHTLGLGENPPSSAEITRRVLAGCRDRR